MFNHVIQDCVLWTRGPKNMGIYVALFNMNLRGSILLLWEAKGASKLLEGKEKKKSQGQMLFPGTPEGRCYPSKV